MSNLLGALKERILIGDGAMGTFLYSFGIDRCFEELNLTHSEDVKHVHEAYIQSGSDLIQTNTYGANYIKLSRYGLEDDVRKINTQAVKIARDAAKDKAFVIGTIGGVRGFKKQTLTLEDIKRSFREQLYCLLLAGVDGLLLETYYDFEELKTVLDIARRETDLPIISHVTMHEPGTLQNGMSLNEALHHLADHGANVVGTNCRLGPYHMIQALENVALPKNAYLSAYPNASLPDYEDGKLVYQTEPDYFKKYAVDFRNEGVRLLGGCCGTTPEQIRAFKEGVQSLEPIQEKKVKVKVETIELEKSPSDTTLFSKIKNGRSLIVEFDAPRHLDTKVFFDGSRALKEAGADAVTLADNSLASPRISNAAIATKLQNEYDVPTLVHLTCRDRNLIGLQSHLMGLHILGLHDILAVTGDPTKIGDFPGATSVYDVSSIQLIELIKQFNEGVSFSGKSLKGRTSFRVAAAFNPNVRNLDRAVARMERKIASGADYFITQPIFDPNRIVELSEATQHIKAPIFVGLMPLTSSRNAEFLHNEVPGIQLTDQAREIMAKVAGNKEQSAIEGVQIAKELIDVAMEHFKGTYLITPMMRYDMTVELTKYVRTKESHQGGVSRANTFA
ncbi:bifunctional homocysteine S-methyltransferase/methylenetetrahydrofolate reductase [Terrilactibacillus sp. BCM23-1]|uniref:Bifunctional homocysteine S-methyltransferase/methylenetetrahydrofolate reductase n=1 Tax=Terrilactibacillus tamarindi TaxID=2599694 RepID=A0A6N8CSR0_9BACI|nr:bifunctional homocysteine S-methyltransferase/methylenetetrahydrofolate reductase [Terrilactibacillus tamarindi]MTT33222.1 bifunctional homocysteine S-methyltransferase/methylenetetrahydrofolate reductase [Terrilactibacillus tamarindi]